MLLPVPDSPVTAIRPPGAEVPDEILQRRHATPLGGRTGERPTVVSSPRSWRLERCRDGRCAPPSGRSGAPARRGLEWRRRRHRSAGTTTSVSASGIRTSSAATGAERLPSTTRGASRRAVVTTATPAPDHRERSRPAPRRLRRPDAPGRQSVRRPRRRRRPPALRPATSRARRRPGWPRRRASESSARAATDVALGASRGHPHQSVAGSSRGAGGQAPVTTSPAPQVQQAGDQSCDDADSEPRPRTGRRSRSSPVDARCPRRRRPRRGRHRVVGPRRAGVSGTRAS